MPKRLYKIHWIVKDGTTYRLCSCNIGIDHTEVNAVNRLIKIHRPSKHKKGDTIYLSYHSQKVSGRVLTSKRTLLGTRYFLRIETIHPKGSVLVWRMWWRVW